MNFTISEHAAKRLRRRGIPIEWVAAVLDQPEHEDGDEDDESKWHVWARLAAAGGRVIHVVYNIDAVPVRVITDHFERNGLP